MAASLRFPVSKKKAALLLLGSLGFVAIGWSLRAEHPIVGWLSVLFFGLGIPAAIYMLFTQRLYLLLDQAGFEMGSPFKTVRVAWNEVDGFESVSISGARMISILYNERYKDQQMLRGAAHALTGVEGAVPNNYTASMDEVLASLREWHARYGRPGQQAH
jgi:hypothetical protein